MISQKAVRVLLGTQPDPQPEPDDADINEQQRAREPGDPVRDPVLRSAGTLFGVLERRRVDRRRKSLVRHDR
jgi:hypothetical protein